MATLIGGGGGLPAAPRGGPPPPGRGGAQPGGGGGQQRPGQRPGDKTMIYLVCCKNFWSNLFRVTMVSYFFWVGLIYFIGAVVLVTGFQYTSPRVATVIACPMQSSVYLMIGAWLVQSFVFFFTCWGYATISSAGKKDSLAEFDRSGGPGGAAGGAAGGRGGGGGARPPDEAQAEGVYMADDLKFDRLTTGLSILGVFVKTVPTWIRLLHVFNMCQFIVWLIDLLLLPECNASGLRWIIGIALVFWWSVIILGVVAKRKIFVPPALYDPVRPGQGALRSLRHLLRSFGP